MIAHRNWNVTGDGSEPSALGRTVHLSRSPNWSYRFANQQRVIIDKGAKWFPVEVALHLRNSPYRRKAFCTGRLAVRLFFRDLDLHKRSDSRRCLVVALERLPDLGCWRRSKLLLEYSRQCGSAHRWWRLSFWAPQMPGAGWNPLLRVRRPLSADSKRRRSSRNW